MSRRRYYPMCVSLERRRCLVVGGGPVAQRKVTTLLQYGANVTIVSPELTPALKRGHQSGKFVYRQRAFRVADVRGYDLIFAATNDRKAQRSIHRAATRAGAWVNMANAPNLCDFIVPAHVRRGGVTIAINTNGTNPALSKHIRQQLDRVVVKER